MYLPFHRKYRPLIFNDVVGQETVVAILRKEILLNSIPNSYIFSGSRGSGKTSLARIVSRSLNCANLLEDGSPCNKCDNCKLSLSGQFPDSIEMDAGTNSGVDDSRALTEDTKYGAKYGKYKIYIIDEAHNISKKAWDCLLKTIEEPISTVKFIFCTTEINKIPNTILSRSQVFNFTKINESLIFERLKYISKLENLNINDSLLLEISIKCDGILRDALVLLEQVYLIKDDEVLLKSVLTRVSKEEIETFLNLLFDSDYNNAFKYINFNKIDDLIFIEKLLFYLCSLVVNENEIFNKIGKNKFARFLELISNWKLSIGKTFNRMVLNELTIILLIDFLNKKEDNILNHIEKLKNKLTGSYEKKSDTWYIITSKNGVKLNVITSESKIPSGYYCFYPNDTLNFINSNKTPLELIREGTIKQI
jgi:DNA polymerase-3 subunit gamma/tau